MTVHIVEDDPGVRDALSELCRSVGLRVMLYADGRSFRGGEHVREGDVVLVDLGLPDQPGVDVVRQAQALPLPPRIIVISGLSLGEIVASMKHVAEVPVMRKPLTPEIVSMLL
jgi:FixJ family two-component response regulator